MDTRQHKKYKILLLGDNCIDTYIYGVVNRISPEAPVPVFEPHTVIEKDGMAGNVCKNLEALGCEVNFFHTETSKKERLIEERSKQQMLRIDRDSKCMPLLPNFIDEQELESYDAIVISDYNKGTVPYHTVMWLRDIYQGPIFIDTKKTDLIQFEGCYVKINQTEKQLAKTLPSSQWLITTYGDKGAVYEGAMFDSASVGDVTDVTGAGDTFLSALAYKFIDSRNIKTAINFANKAASVTVRHVGVYAPKLEEIV